eukprot:3330426-Rhodomonas_salina.1
MVTTRSCHGTCRPVACILVPRTTLQYQAPLGQYYCRWHAMEAICVVRYRLSAQTTTTTQGWTENLLSCGANCTALLVVRFSLSKQHSNRCFCCGVLVLYRARRTAGGMVQVGGKRRESAWCCGDSSWYSSISHQY